MKVTIIVLAFYLLTIMTVAAEPNVGHIIKSLPELRRNDLMDSVLYEFETNKISDNGPVKGCIYIVSIVGTPYNCTINIARSPSNLELVITNRNLLGFICFEGDYFVFCDICNDEWKDILKRNESCIREFHIFYRLMVIYEKEWNLYIKNGKIVLITQPNYIDEYDGYSTLNHLLY